MGIADFGVTGPGTGGSAYAYATSSFEATAHVGSMSITATSGSSTYHVVAFELNAVLLLQRGGTNYSYWIQNGLHVDTSSEEYTIGGAYVWNFSSPSAHLSAGELQGNASSLLAPDTYYFIPACGGFPGQCSTVSFPATFTARIAISSCAGEPCVEYEYDIGTGWVTYDTVTFLHMAGATPVGFLVDGSRYTPLGTGTFYDAEWDWVAAGGGLSGRDVGSDLQMALEYWNGVNYQAVPAAWNFGGDTGESSFNVSETLVGSGPGAAPSAELTSGSGTLGLLYNSTDVGYLNVTVPATTPTTLQVDGDPVILPTGWANLTLSGGTHSLALQNYSNATVQVSVRSGQTTLLNLSGAGRTEFQESGLAPGTLWGVTVDGIGRSASGARLAYNLPNGTYGVSYAKVPGYRINGTPPSEITVPVPGVISLTWSAFTYPVPVSESGLPTGTTWWVNASGTLITGAGSTLLVPAPNGSTPYSVGASYAFIATPGAGNLTVTGGAILPVQIQFSYRPGYITGTVSPKYANVTIGGVVQTVTAGIFNDSVIPGEYTLVASAPGFLAKSLEVNATPGNYSVEQISLEKNPSAPASTTSNASSPSFPDVLVVGVVIIAAVAVVGVAAFLMQRRRSD